MSAPGSSNIDGSWNTNQSSDINTALNIANVVLGCLIVIFAAAVVYVNFIYEPQADSKMTERYAAVAKERLESHADVIQDEAADLAAEIVPPIAQAVQQQLDEDYSRYVRALEREGQVYLDHVEVLLQEKLRAHYKDFLVAHRQVLKEEFPQHASEKNVERVLADFEQVFNKLANRYYINEFERQTDRTVALWKQFKPLDTPGPNEPSLEEQLADYAADWAVVALADTGQSLTLEANVSDHESKGKQR